MGEKKPHIGFYMGVFGVGEWGGGWGDEQNLKIERIMEALV